MKFFTKLSDRNAEQISGGGPINEGKGRATAFLNIIAGQNGHTLASLKLLQLIGKAHSTPQSEGLGKISAPGQDSGPS